MEASLYPLQRGILLQQTKQTGLFHFWPCVFLTNSRIDPLTRLLEDFVLLEVTLSSIYSGMFSFKTRLKTESPILDLLAVLASNTLLL